MPPINRDDTPPAYLRLVSDGKLPVCYLGSCSRCSKLPKKGGALDMSRELEMPKVLVIDDNEGIRDLLHCTMSDYQVSTACDGEEAVRFLTENDGDIDAIILDVIMPITDGWETLRIIKDEENGWPLIPVIMLTSKHEPESVLKAWTLGALYYCPKPFSVPQLCELVNKAMVHSGRNSQN